MDIYFTVSQIKSPMNIIFPEEEVVYQSEVYFGYHRNALPISWEIKNIPLGESGYSGFDNPRVTFYDNDTGEVIAQCGYRASFVVNGKYDPDSQKGEYTHGAVMSDGSLIKVLYSTIFP